jgi:hypothetical protein
VTQPQLVTDTTMLRECINNPKFHGLKRAVGRPLYQTIGILESLWLLTAQCAPAGDIGRFSDEQIEAWLEWDGEPGNLVAILRDKHWLDGVDDGRRLLVHDWADHCPQHLRRRATRGSLTFADTLPLFTENGLPLDSHSFPLDANGRPLDDQQAKREEKKERCAKERREEKLTPTTTTTLSSLAHLSSLENDGQPLFTTRGEWADGMKPSFGVLAKIWNRIPGVTHCRQLTEKRRRAFGARRKVVDWWEQVPLALVRVAASKFCQGTGEGSWVADIDWFLRPDTVTKLLEGKYDDRKSRGGGRARPDGRVYE